MEEIKWPTEERWQCNKCDQYIDMECVKEFTYPGNDEERINLLMSNRYVPGFWTAAQSGKINYHMSFVYNGFGGDRTWIGCGPINKVTVSTQELFMEWLESWK